MATVLIMATAGGTRTIGIGEFGRVAAEMAATRYLVNAPPELKASRAATISED